MFSIKKVSLTLNNQTILKDVSFDANQGEIIGLIGPNGAGKSSLIKVLANLVYPDSGEILINKNKCHFVDLKNYCGYLIDSPAFYPFLSASQNLELFARINQLKIDTQALLNSVGLFDAGKKKVRHFSTGMKQRLAIAQTLIRDPQVLILDEPFNGLDPNGFQDLVSLIHKINQEGKTILISSHLLNDLEELATHFILMHKGKIAMQISKEDLQKIPKKVEFIFETDISESAKELFSALHVEKIQEKKVLVNLKPDKIAETISKLVHSGNTPLNVQTRTVLQDKYMQITQ
ncbi:ABC transporter ATP-binding protein [Namhaeicola litoreus]|uniref:ABC transporter ATP-binding protein n=1 Tax=Namhaeicola litoreus TaxID=1052145 RepID=A0ABW3XYM2_9FLAO